MIYLMTVAILAGDLAASASLAGTIEVEDRDPIVLTADVEVPDGWSSLVEWDVDKPAKGREFENGSKLCIWAPPGQHEVTLAVTMAKVVDGAIQFKKQKKVYVLKVRGPPDQPEPSQPSQPTTTDKKVTQVTYVYERTESTVPGSVQTLFRQLNGRGVLATAVDDDTITGTGQIPEQYRVAFAAAKEAGLPCLVVQSGDVVLKAVRSPTAADLEALKP